ncbi:MAG: fatty acid desaturase [Parvibaculum sp.]|nr:fatty acid desaturase [Parvibaculum sp.]
MNDMTNRGLSAAEVARTYVKSGVDWVIIAWTAFGLSVIAASTYAGLVDAVPLWAAFLTNVYFMFFIFATMHEASHGNIGHGKSAWLNSVLGWICGHVNMVPYRGWGDLHVWHHSHVNNGAMDPDEWVKGYNPLNVVFRAATIPQHYLYFYAKSRAYAKVRGGYFAYFWIVMTWVITLSIGAYVWATTGNYKLLVLWPLAGYMNIFIMGMMFVWFPHFPRAGQGRTDNSTTYVFHGLTGALMRPFDLWQSYHLVHHAFPRVPFYRQGKLFSDIRHHIEADGSAIVEI